MRKISLCLISFICCVLSLSCSDTTSFQKQGTDREEKKVAIPSLSTQSSRTISVAKPVRTANVHASMIYLESLSAVQQRLDAIIIGKPTQDFISREHHTEYSTEDYDIPGNVVDSRWSRGPFLINRVLYKKTGINVAAGQGISLAEPVGLTTNVTAGTVRHIIASCYELRQNSEYVVFVSRAPDGTYAYENFNLGRFNTDGTDCYDELNITNGTYPDGTKTMKQKLRDELTAQYGISFAPIGPCSSESPAITARNLGMPSFDGTRAIVRVTINPPQPGTARLQIQQQATSTSAWTQISDVPVIPAAQTGTTPVTQEIKYTYGLSGSVRYRILNGTPSAWSAPVPVQIGI